MSFESEYAALRKKRLKEEEERLKKMGGGNSSVKTTPSTNSSSKNSSSSFMEEYSKLREKRLWEEEQQKEKLKETKRQSSSKKEEDDDIAPSPFSRLSRDSLKKSLQYARTGKLPNSEKKANQSTTGDSTEIKTTPIEESIFKAIEKKRRQYGVDSTKLTEEEQQAILDAGGKLPDRIAANVTPAEAYYLAQNDIERNNASRYKEADNKVFKAGAFEDGVDGVGDGIVKTGKTVGGTVGDIGVNILKGIGNMGEGITDLAGYGIASVADLVGADDMAYDMKRLMKQNAVNDFLAPAEKEIDRNSVLGDKSDAVSQAVGQVGGIILTGAAGGAAGLGSTATSLLTSGTMFASGTGSGMSQAYSAGASDAEALTYGIMAGAAETATEMIFGGLGKGVNALGVSKGLSSADDMLAKWLTQKITNTLAKNTIQLGVKMSAEGVEEVAAGFLQAWAKDVAYMNEEKEEDFLKILQDENLLEQFIVGALASGFAQSPGYISNTSKGRDYITNRTKEDQQVIDKVIEDRVKGAEKEGKTLTKKEKGDIEKDVIKEFERGGISTDTIEEVLAGDDVKTWRETAAREDAELKEYNELAEIPENELSRNQRKRLDELESRLTDIKDKTESGRLRGELDSKMGELTKNSPYLTESYNERAREYQALEVDTSQYKDEYAKKTLENLVAKKKVNNTYRVRQFAESMAKLAQRSKQEITFVTNEELRTSEHAFKATETFEADGTKATFDFKRHKIDGEEYFKPIVKVNGEVVTEGYTIDFEKGSIAFDTAPTGDISVQYQKADLVNGYRTKDGIAINLDGRNTWEFTAGHEITHSLEKTDAYKAYREAVIQFAKDTGIYEDMKASKEGTYRKGTDIDGEIAGDIAGQFIFTEDFVNNLASKQRNVAQRILDWIKHQIKMVTAGSPEAKQLEQARYLYEKALDQASKAEKHARVQHSISDDFALDDEILLEEGFLSDEQLDELLGTGWITKLGYETKAKPRYKGDTSTKGKTASLTAERIDRLIREYGASNPSYAQAYITSIHPRDFLSLTISDEGLERWDNAATEGYDPELQALDVDRLKAETQTPFLEIDTMTGEVIGHEGRHRMRALLEAGITEVPIAVIDYTTKYSKQKTDNLHITSQQFRDGPVNNNFGTDIKNLIPINNVNKSEIESAYGGDGDVQYSISDTDYMDAVNNGDMETAQRLVDEAAKVAGYDTSDLYHGTNAFGFTTVDNNAPGADGYSFWAADKETTSATYTNYGRVRQVSSTISDEDIESFEEEIDSEIDDEIDNFRRLIDRTFSEWYFGYGGNDQLRSDFDDANSEMGHEDGIYDVFESYIADAYYQYKDYLDDAYEDYDVWVEESEEGQKLINSVLALEGLRRKQEEFGTKELGGIYKLYANTDNMYEVDCRGANWNALKPEGLPERVSPYNTRDVAEWAKNNGYDGVIFKNIEDNGQYGYAEASNVYAFFKPNSQVKSADPVTYDDNGKPIPLSERFKEANDDIRYSISDSEYLDAVKNDDKETAKRLVDRYAIEKGFTVDEDGMPELLFHGTDSFGFTNIDTSKSDDDISFWATPNMGVAGSYYEGSNYKVRELGKNKITPKGEKLVGYESFEEIVNRARPFASEMGMDVSKAKYVNESKVMKKAQKPIKKAISACETVLNGDFSADVKKIASRIINASKQGTYKAWTKALNSNTWNEYSDTTGVHFWELDIADNFSPDKSDISKITQVDPDVFKMMWHMGKVLDAISQDDWGTLNGEDIDKYDIILPYNNVVSEKGIYGFYHTESNPFIYDCDGSKWNQIAVPNEAKGDFNQDVVSTRDLAKWAFEHGYDAIKLENVIDVSEFALKEARAPADVWAFKTPEAQLKSADPVTYDDNGNVIPLSERFNTENDDIRYSLSSMGYSFFGDENANTDRFVNRDYKETEGYKSYVEQTLSNYRQTRGDDFDEEATRKEIEDAIDGITQVAVAAKLAGYDIKDDAKKRNVRDSKGRLLFSSLEPNSDYFTSNDISSICDKRKNFAEIYDDIVKAEETKGVPENKRFFRNVDNYFYLHQLMAEKGLTQPCRQCYVESMRKNLAPMADAFLRLVTETDPNNKANDQLFQTKGKNKGQPKVNNTKLRERVLEALESYDMSPADLSRETLTTADGLAMLKLTAPNVYEAFNSFYGQSKPKMPREATPFRFGELTALLTDEHGKVKPSLVEKINHTGGFRLQSYSDFQIENFVDTLQVIFEAGSLGLKGHAYTKVPAFLDATKGTNLKRNISIFMYSDGGEWKIDRNDSFPYKLDKIYDLVESDETGNTSIIAVSQNADMSAWIMANDLVGYGIPFHKSGVKMGVVRDTIVREGGREIKGYSNIKDHTRQQSEVYADTKKKVSKPIDIYSFWDFENAEGLPKNELIRKNLETYIDRCLEAGYLPKFREYVMDNGKVLRDTLRHSKELGYSSPDATIDDISFEYRGFRIPYGYYKFLGDFGMFTPNGEASPSQTLSLKDYDFAEATKFFEDAKGLQAKELLQQFSNGDERSKYRAMYDKGEIDIEGLKKVIAQKRGEIVDDVVSGRAKRQHSITEEWDDIAPGTPLRDLQIKEEHPIRDDVAPAVDETIDDEVIGRDSPVEDAEVTSMESPIEDDIAPPVPEERMGMRFLMGDEYENPLDARERMIAEDDIAPTTQQLAEEEAREHLDYLARTKSTTQQLAEEEAREHLESLANPNAQPGNEVVRTVKDREAKKLQNYETELENKRQQRASSYADFDADIARLQAEYDSLKNKNTQKAANLLNRIDRTKTRQANIDAMYEKRISDLEGRIDKMNTPVYKRSVQAKAKQEQYRTEARQVMGDTTHWRDKKLGIMYSVNTLARNLRDIVRDATGKQDLAKADEIYEWLQGTYNHNEAELNRESARIKNPFAEMNITNHENVYAQMLGELRHNPDTKLTEDVVNEYYQKHKKHIDTAKVDEIIDKARETYDSLLQRVNAVLREQGMKEIPYRKGYFPHFTNPKQGRLAKLFNWKVKDDSIPTDIAGLTEQFNPNRSWQSFNKQRKTDDTDYNFAQGLDNYVRGALDWIYHIEDIQKRRAFENEIRYVHSEQGIKDKIEALKKNEEYDADELQEQIDLVYDEARNPLNNFVQNFRTATNTLAGKKSSMDRGVEAETSRKIYSVMTNVSNRVNANMVVGSISSALTNFIPITQSWAEVNPVRSIGAMAETLRNIVKDDGTINKSDFLTNRLRQAENLYKTGWDKASDKVGILMNVFDNFTSQTVWRSKYNQNLANGMSETEAIHNADRFTEGVMAGRSRGNMPTIFDSKNPLIKIFTAFQLEVANQYGYALKDVPQNVEGRNQAEKIAKLTAGYAGMFFGAYAYNALFSQLTGRNSAFDPVRIVQELLADMGFGGDDDDEEKKVSEITTNLAENIVDEIPFISTLTGGGRIPLNSALPYDGLSIDSLTQFMEDFEGGDWSSIGKEMLNPVYYMAMPFGGGQLKKTVQGLSMFDDDLPISGSYTDSGALRYPVDETPWNVTQAALFGQYANKNARDYFDRGQKPLEDKQLQEFIDADMPIQDYWDYRAGLKGLSKAEEKADYINSLDIPLWKKNLFINNLLDRKEDIDMEDYGDYDSLAEFDFANEYPEKYDFFKQIGLTYDDYARSSDKAKDAYNWAYKNPEKYEVSKIISDDVRQYRQHVSALDNIKGDDKKKRTEAYINKLDIDYGAKCIFFKTRYKSDHRYDNAIINYLTNERDDISVAEKRTILEELGFVIDKNGTIRRGN